MAVADNDILDILRRGTTTPLDFHYDQLTAPPIGMVFSEEDIMQLYKIATSVKLAGNAKKRLKMIDDVMKFRGCLKLAGGTNRVVYYHPDVPGVVYKVAIDAVGIKDNPAEFINQNFIKPFCCKVFECHPTGIIASFERLDRITSFLEFYSVADDVYQLITKVLIGKYVLEDIGTDYFMNFAIRRGLINRRLSWKHGGLQFCKLLGKAKALLPIWNRKIETSREMVYGEIKAYYI